MNTSSAVMAQRHEAPDSLDDFPPPPWATRALLERLTPIMRPDMTAWEPAANRGYMVAPLRERFGSVLATDAHDYGAGFPVRDFLLPYEDDPIPDWIITNPPFRLASEFTLRALDLATAGVAMLCRLQWIEGQRRYEELFKTIRPRHILVFCERVAMVKGRYDPDMSSATAYAWFVWTKSGKGKWSRGSRKLRSPTLDWFPPGTKARHFKETDI